MRMGNSKRCPARLNRSLIHTPCRLGGRGESVWGRGQEVAPLPGEGREPPPARVPVQVASPAQCQRWGAQSTRSHSTLWDPTLLPSHPAIRQEMKKEKNKNKKHTCRPTATLMPAVVASDTRRLPPTSSSTPAVVTLKPRRQLAASPSWRTMRPTMPRTAPTWVGGWVGWGEQGRGVRWERCDQRCLG